jgi:putative membrane-bound dehydrogenase-like protein
MTLKPAIRAENVFAAVRILLTALYLCRCCEPVAAADEPEKTASLVVRGRIWTGDASRPWVEAVAVRGERIAAVGAWRDIEPLIDGQTEVIDAGDGLVVPGLIDCHIHLIDGGLQLTRVELRDANSRDEFVRRIEAFAKKQKQGTWITGGDWDHTLWGGELPSRDWIDQVTPNHPVWIHRLDGHMALANTAAMRAAKIGDDVQDVRGGTIVRDARGRPTGVFKDNALDLIEQAVPAVSLEEQLQATVAAMDYLAERGVTGVHHMGTWKHLDVFRLAKRRGLLKTRIYALTPLAAWKRLQNEVRRHGRGDEWLQIGGLKGFVDGSLGSHTAAMLRPFTDEPEDLGLLVNTADDLERWTMRADRAGLQVAVHAIGDRANRLQLDVFERVATANGPRDRRFRIEHAQHIAPDDIPRFAKLGVIASMQPYHTIDDGRWAEEVIGPRRSETSYAFRSLLAAGGRLAFGSDWSVAPPTPLEGVFAAVTRRTLDGKHPNGWVPQQKISVEDALRAYTRDAAYAGFSESSLGSLEPGKLADIVIIDRDLFQVPAEELADARVSATIVGGKVVYRDGEQKSTVRLDLLPAVEPAAAVSTFVAPAGFRVEQVAAEPLVRDPMAMEFDENGIAYVIELPPYNAQGQPGPRPPTSIARLEDADGDGRFDRRTTFVDDLKYATGLFCYDGGLIVGDPPDLLFLRDSNGDGRADEREVLFTGFGSAPVGESQLNSFRWGLDNRIHISTGSDGGELRPAGQPDAPPQNVRNRRVLLDPRTRTIDLTSGGGQHGMCFDDWGRVFVCSNSAPIDTIVYDDRYLERNPHMNAPAAAIALGPGAGYEKLERLTPVETWRLVRSRLLSEGQNVTDTYEWDRVSGVFTAATGITVYRGHAWPKEFLGQVFVGEVVNNLVYRARLTPAGVTVASAHADEHSGFLASTDTWFRPAQFAHGPDGNLYVLDMYRQLIEGVKFIPPEVLAQMDPTAGTDRGRIYRIVPGDFEQPPPVRLGKLSTESLVALLAHPNSWHRETAARLLYERQDANAVQPLRKLLAECEFAPGRLHAIYALDGLQALQADDVVVRLEDPHPGVRRHAVRLAEQFAGVGKVQEKLVQLTADPDVEVRFQLAFSIGSLPAALRDAALVELLKRDGADAWFRMALQTSLARGAARVFESVLNDVELRAAPHGQSFLAALASQLGRANDGRDLRVAVAAIDRLAVSRNAEGVARPLVVALLGAGSKTNADALMELSQGGVREVIANMLISAREVALDARQPVPSRIKAIENLSWSGFSEQRPALEELLEPRQPQPIQQAALNTLSRSSEPAVAELLLAKWQGLTPSLRASAAELLFTRPGWVEALLAAIETEQVPVSDIDPARVTLLQSHPDERIRKRAATVFSNSGLGQRSAVVEKYQAALALAGSAERGRQVFRKSCSACHALEGVGTSVGADLNAIRDRGLDAVMLNVLDPNREIKSEFLSYMVATTDGRVITGMITEETPNNLTIRQADGTPLVISRIDIEAMKSTGISYMPEGLEKDVDVQAMADLLAYLDSI